MIGGCITIINSKFENISIEMLNNTCSKGIEILNNREDTAFVGYDMYHITKSTGKAEKILKWIFQVPILIWGYKNCLKNLSVDLNSSILSISELNSLFTKYPTDFP